MIRFLVPFLLLPAPLAAQDRFGLPAGCDAYLTIQARNCSVTHHFTCEGDPEGYQRRVDLTEEGMVYAGMIDAETQWIESIHVASGHSETLENESADPASMTELMRTGEDTYDFTTFSAELGQTRYEGYDRLTGGRVTIDGVTLQETEFAIIASDSGGTVLWQSEGNEYISEDWRMFLSGASRTTSPDGTWESDDSPVEFIFPDEPGFLSANPKHCGATTAAWEVPQ